MQRKLQFTARIAIFSRTVIAEHMVHIFDGDSEIGAHARHCYLIYFRHLIRTRTVTNRIFLIAISIFLHACAPNAELPSTICTIAEQDYLVKKKTFISAYIFIMVEGFAIFQSTLNTLK